MPWTKGKIEKAWRVFDKSMGVIAEALEVDVLELKALLLDGTVPPYERETMEVPAATMEADSHVKRATLADLAPPRPETVLEQAQPIIAEPIQFTTHPPFSTMSPAAQAAVMTIGQAAAKQIRENGGLLGGGEAKPSDDMIGRSLEDQPLPRRRSNLASAAEDKRRTNAPAEFHLMLEGRYLHESCTGLTDSKAHAWRQPEGKIAAVRRKFPETVDYEVVPAK